MSGAPLLWLGGRDVLAAGGANIPAAIADIRTTLAALRAGDAEMPAETSVRLGGPGETQSRTYALPARVGPHAGVKWTAHRPGGAVSLTMVNNADTGWLVGVVESALLTATRTAAVSGLVLQARAPRRIALLGAGVQARAHLRMLAALFPGLERLTVWNRTASRADVMVAGTPMPFPCVAEPVLEAALADADAVLSCTNAASPILPVDVVRPGRSVLQIGYHEVPFDAIDRADCVLVDLWGEFRLSSAKSLFQMHRAGRFEAGRVAADLAAIALDGWCPTPDAAVYFSSFGLNLFDVALAASVLRRAAAIGLGSRHAMEEDVR